MKKQKKQGNLGRNKLKYVVGFGILMMLMFSVFMVFYHPPKEAEVVSSTATQNNTAVEEKKSITIHLAAIGDAMCHSQNFKDAYQASTKNYDFSHVFTNIRQKVESADIAIGNLETTFAGAEKGYSGFPTFNTPDALGYALKDMGVDVLSTANNHSLDKGYSGIVRTLDVLDEAGISHMGTYRSLEEQNKILIKDVNGIKFAFLSFTYGTNGIPVPKGKEYCINLIDETLMKRQIDQAKEEQVDVICVSMHWGDEYKIKQNKTQENLADFLFENGVDIILGSHPHVLEPMEKRTITLADGTTKDGFVIYSLGNFISAQKQENTRNTIILDLQITKNPEGKISIDKVEYTPLYVYDKGAGKPQRYKILDIRQTIANYENGTDTSIGATTYKTLKVELTKIESIMGNNF
ncbi:MAG: CapA family protein [Clostridia bacterium]|nr:CapA family protein [Clostridia bacterium]